MQKTMLNIKIEPELKRRAQKLAKEMGAPLSLIVNTQLRNFLNERRIELSAIPTIRLSGKAAVELDALVKEGRREHHEGKTVQAGSLKDALKRHRR